jgi:hypothetical protein
MSPVAILLRSCLLSSAAVLATAHGLAAQEGSAGLPRTSATETHATGSLLSAIRDALAAPPPRLSSAVASPPPTFRVTIEADEAARFKASLSPLLTFTDEEKRMFRMNARGGLDPLILLHASRRAARWYEASRARRQVAGELERLQQLTGAAQAASEAEPSGPAATTPAVPATKKKR